MATPAAAAAGWWLKVPPWTKPPASTTARKCSSRQPTAASGRAPALMPLPMVMRSGETP